MSFIQIVDYETDRPEEIEAQMQELESGPDMTFSRMQYTRDRDNPKHYQMIVEFPSFDEAMANSRRPETDAMAKQLASLCTKGPSFANLDVLMTR